jgi:hypothetical protein
MLEGVTDLKKDRFGLEVGKLPVMRTIPMGSLLLHEEPDPRRAGPLEKRIASDRRLRSPVIAARDHDPLTHMLLDGANRVEALRRLGARHVLIQEVDLEDEQVALSTWHHVLEGLDAARFLDRLSAVARVRRAKAEFTRGGDFIPRHGRGVACLVVLPDKRAFAVLDGATPERRLEASKQVVAETASASNVDRVSYSHIGDLARHYPRFSALVCFKGFAKQEVFRLACGGKKFPSGLTRFSVPKRAVALSLPLAFLTERGSTRSKQAKLDATIRRAIAQKRIRFYEEPTFYFDD